jgi:hypothetical protein
MGRRPLPRCPESKDLEMESSKRELIESVFAGDGEMATRMRAVDWSTTSLGPVEQWPQALRTSIRIVLDSGWAMSICWGPDFKYLYNDGYMRLIGTNHPSALGRPYREVYPEALHLVESVYDSTGAESQVPSRPPISG